MHLGLGAASAVIAAPSSPDGPPDALRCAQDLVAGDRPGGVGLPGLGVLAGWDDRGSPAGGDRVMALAGVEGPSAVTLAISCPGGIWSSRSGSMGASPTSLVVNSAALISNDFSSIPMWILRQTRRFVPPCLRAFHSPSPSTLIPVLSTSRCRGPSEPR